ncbi:hypothetical protein JX265_006096 [Neoarthrinium moseri]|uniref:Cytochrome P450 n=1 Tax=Neoarthrinium moseri TaxID=1658444 RepID=A0A9P9WMH6_9PEZI|nr:uncharacterized protein JN550_004311 [Neoarthrinium moseri]KAI1855692.1 hypothetical protein JX266_000557 [Neoarthrinium moseri]KAI1871056.1 hypothetical protein JX265_006096 [Neoarthrinium moseri]KAI1872108.1 hypothetical protein JN550_004311 [Neoarthrinium moseri]
MTQVRALPKKRLLEFQTPFLTVAPTVRFNVLGEGFITIDPENIETIIKTRFEDYHLGDRSNQLYRLLGEGIFTQDGSAWQLSRRILQKQFVRVREAGIAALQAHVDTMLANIGGEDIDNGTVVDLQPHFFEYTLNTTTHLLFGEPHSALPKLERDALRNDFEYASQVSANRMRLANLCWLYTPPKFIKACRNVRNWAQFFADKALHCLHTEGIEAAGQKYPFIVDLWQELGDRSLVRDQLLHVLIAGRDTTACLLSWTL